MGIELAKAWVRVRGDASRVQGDLQRGKPAVLASVRSLAGAMSGILAAVGLSVGVQQLLQNLREMIELAQRQLSAETRLAAVVRATGGAAGFTAEQLFQQARSLQAVTTFGDEAIIEMQAILATFRKIRGDNFERTARAAMDLSSVLGSSLTSAAVQLGKALEDPRIGVSALAEAGVSFTVAQKEQIKALVEQNRLFEAQVIVLSEIEGQMGGVAEAMARTDTGQIAQINNQIGDMKEQVGEELIPATLAFKEAWLGVLEVIQDTLKSMRILGFVASQNRGRSAIDALRRLGPAGEVAIRLIESQSVPRPVDLPALPTVENQARRGPQGEATAFQEDVQRANEEAAAREEERQNEEARRAQDRERRRAGIDDLDRATAVLERANAQAERDRIREQIQGSFGELQAQHEAFVALRQGLIDIQESPLLQPGRFGFGDLGTSLQDSLINRQSDVERQIKLMQENNVKQQEIVDAIREMQTGLGP